MRRWAAPAITITADYSLAQAAKELAAHEVKRLPVVDQSGRLQGIVSRADLLKGYLRGEADRRSTAQLVSHLCGLVPGVVEVHDGLSWRCDDTQDATGYFRSHPFSAEAR